MVRYSKFSLEECTVEPGQEKLNGQCELLMGTETLLPSKGCQKSKAAYIESVAVQEKRSNLLFPELLGRKLKYNLIFH